MKVWDIDKLCFTTRCQKCKAPDVVVPLASMKGPVAGSLFIPDVLHCSHCGSQLTVQTREYRKDEKKAEIVI